ncbi:MAG: bis(5'-nucleosyl)-tetraphosphatase (symmetrical) YqeK [Actinobacteria bacterium]|nr:bis(5'-nucleosyl)-tetraphosphatase (symmetrical) YqeK [Actinomycetota bacterium]
MDFINKLILNENQKECILNINKKISNVYPPDLYKHTISTLFYTQKLAEKYILKDDENKESEDFKKNQEVYYKLCKIALLHDYGRIFDAEELKKIALKNKDEINANQEDFEIDCLLHGFAGAFIVRDEFNLSDEEILNSIKYHTTGYCNMSMTDKIIYISDKLEDGRNYKEVFYLRKLALKNINFCLLEVYKNNIIYIINKNKNIYSNTFKIWNNILKLYGGLTDGSRR